MSAFKSDDCHGGISLERLPDMVAGVWSDHPSLQLRATTQFRKLLATEESPPIDQVIGSGVVPRIVEFLKKDDYPQIQLEAAWVLTNIAHGRSDHVKVLTDNNAVPIFVQLLASPSEDVREQVVWALGNIAIDSPPNRDLVLESGALTPLLNQLNEHARLSMVRIATWTLSNLCLNKPKPNFDEVKEALPVLGRLIHSNDEEVLKSACWSLSNLSDGTSDKIQALIESGVVPRLFQLLLHPCPSVVLPALRTLGDMVHGNDEQIQLVIGSGDISSCLPNFLTQKYTEKIKKEACWMISHIVTAGYRLQIQSVVDANLIAPIVDLFQNAEYKTKKEVAFVISNAFIGGSQDLIKYMVEQGCIKPLCDILEVSLDPDLIRVCLEGLETILMAGESLGNTGAMNHYAQLIDDAQGRQKIDKLQSHDHKDIHESAVKILETYFKEEDNETDWMIIDQKDNETEQPPVGDGSQAMSIWKRACSFIESVRL